MSWNPLAVAIYVNSYSENHTVYWTLASVFCS